VEFFSIAIKFNPIEFDVSEPFKDSILLQYIKREFHIKDIGVKPKRICYILTLYDRGNGQRQKE
jgi:hypothetical protein